MQIIDGDMFVDDAGERRRDLDPAGGACIQGLLRQGADADIT
jgi:hypothetical protein